MAHQIAMPVSVTPEEIARKKSLGAALELCADIAGFDKDKQLQSTLGVDKATFSRWQAGTEGIKWDKFVALMDACGNDAPLLWMLHARGYDLHSLRRIESSVERENRDLREQLAAARRLLIGVAA
jgi:hypothetical protein